MDNHARASRRATGCGRRNRRSLARQADCRPRESRHKLRIGLIVYCTCTPTTSRPGTGFLQRELGISDIPGSTWQPCSGFIYGLSVADAWIRTGQ